MRMGLEGWWREADMDMGPAGGRIFIVPNVLAATRTQLHHRLERDADALQACATAIQLPEGAVNRACVRCSLIVRWMVVRGVHWPQKAVLKRGLCSIYLAR